MKRIMPRQIQDLCPRSSGVQHEILEKLVQGRMFEVHFDCLKMGLTKGLPVKQDVSLFPSIREWVDQLTPVQIRTIETSWLANIRGYDEAPDDPDDNDPGGEQEIVDHAVDTEATTFTFRNIHIATKPRTGEIIAAREFKNRPNQEELWAFLNEVRARGFNPSLSSVRLKASDIGSPL